MTDGRKGNGSQAAAIKKMLSREQFHPLKNLVDLYPKLKMQEKLRVNLELLQYIYPKVKAQDPPKTRTGAKDVSKTVATLAKGRRSLPNSQPLFPSQALDLLREHAQLDDDEEDDET